MPKLLCIGHITLDTFLFVEDIEVHCDLNDKRCSVGFAYGAKIPVSDIKFGVGGGASNVVIGTSLLGVNSTIFSITGDDRHGKEIFQLFKSYSIPTDKIIIDNNPTDQSTILSYGIERTIFTYNSDRAYNLDGVDIDGFDYIYVSSIGKNVDLIYDQIIQYKRKYPNKKIFFNPGSKELKFAHHSIQKILSSVDYLLVNVEEGCSLLNTGLKRDDIEISDLISLLEQKGIKTVVLTDAERGVYFNDKYKVEHLPAKIVKAIEKTGAGDSFASGFISSILHGNNMSDSVKWGILNSASAVQKPGAQNGLLTLDQIKSQILNY